MSGVGGLRLCDDCLPPFLAGVIGGYPTAFPPAYIILALSPVDDELACLVCGNSAVFLYGPGPRPVAEARP